MTPSLRAAVALAVLMMRDRMTYRFAGFGTAVSLAVGLILLYLTTLSIQPTEAHIGINSQADLALFLISGGIMTSTLGIYSSQAASWIGNRRSSGMLEAIMASGVSLHHLSYAVILWPALLQFAKVGLTLTVAAWVFGVFPSFETVFWLLAAAGATAVAVWAFGLMGVAWTVAFRRPNPLPRVISLSAVFFAGVAFPPSLLPAWMQDIGLLHPLFHGLKVIREALIHGQTPGWLVLGPLLLWSIIGLVLLPVGHKLVDWSYNYARRHGSLAAR